jgi:hypothetical protein
MTRLELKSYQIRRIGAKSVIIDLAFTKMKRLDLVAAVRQPSDEHQELYFQETDIDHDHAELELSEISKQDSCFGEV